MTDPDARLPDPRMIPRWRPEPTRPSLEPEVDPPRPVTHADEMAVRPFLLTGGRTRPVQDDLRVETLLHAIPAALSAPLRFEARRIVEFCQRPMALADLAVALGVPLGVARVLVGDLLVDGYLQRVEQPDVLPVELIERIRDRVRAL